MGKPGFTLAELLIALLILGVIATFTIPKVLNSQAGSQSKSVAKEVVGMVSGAYQAYVQENAANAGMTMADLTPYFNYVRTSTVGTYDGVSNTSTCAYGAVDCVGSHGCLVLHNGTLFRYDRTATFGGTGSNRAHWFFVDPDAKLSGSGNTAGRGAYFSLFYSGRISDWDKSPAGTQNDSENWGASSGCTPSWFSWD